MATQGLVSFVDKDYNVLAKVAVGCNGFNVDRFIKHVENLNIHHLYEMAICCDFGCMDCLVVSTGINKHNFFEKGNYLGELFHSKFDDPGFNPRWEYGTADYVRIVIWE